MNQTAVEWFVEEMFKQGYFNDKPMTVANINYFANIAKEMEKQQIIEAMDRMGNTDFYCEYESPEHYYKQNFKSE